VKGPRNRIQFALPDHSNDDGLTDEGREGQGTARPRTKVTPYNFTTVGQLLDDFWQEVKRMRDEKGIPNGLLKVVVSTPSARPTALARASS
jgi:hypothetical protein